MTRRLARPLLALAVVPLLGAAACGGGSTATAVPKPPATTAPVLAPAAAVAAAPDAVRKAGSSKLAMTITGSAGGQTFEMTGEGAFDYARRIGRLSMTLPQLGSGKLEELLTPDTIYLAMPGLTPAGKYMAIDLRKLVAGGGNAFSSLGQADPSQSLQLLRGASNDVTAVGTETVRGEQTTHYRGSIQVSKALARIPAGVLRDQMQKILGGSTTEIPFDAYLDSAGRLRKIVEKVTVPASAATNGVAVDVSTTIEMFDFGTPVTVTAPPAADTIDGSQLLGQLGGGKG